MPKQESLDPVLNHFLKDLKARKRPGHSLNPMIDRMAVDLVENPEIFYRARWNVNYMESLLLVAGQLKVLVAEKLAKPQLNEANYLTIELEEDWRINAEVEQEPPYHIYISTNLYRFCAMLSKLLIGGLGLTMTDDDTKSGDMVDIAPSMSKAEVIQKVKSVLDRFHKDRTIPAEDSMFTLEHTKFHDITFYSIMASIVGHEFGHVVINEEHLREGSEAVKPYADFAEGLLRSNAQNLLYTPIHDPDDLTGFNNLSQSDIKQVASNWIKEITADLIGVDLARKYHRDFGPAKTIPDVVAYAQMGIHLCFIAQMFLYCYLNYRNQKFQLFSTIYPPIDFRLHCVVNWMYSDPQHPCVLRLIDYCQEILNGVLSDTT